MDLYNFSNNKLAQIERQDFALEKEIQDLVEANVSELFNLQFISSEFQIDNFRLDTLCYDEDEKHYELTELGLIASNIAEVHPILLTHVLRKYQMFLSFDVDQIIGLLAVFCDVNIDKNVKRNFPFSKDACFAIVTYL